MNAHIQSYQNLRVVLAYKNFAAMHGISHIGLGVSAINACKVLQKAGIKAQILPLKNEVELRQYLNLQQSNPTDIPITHVIVSAPWVTTAMYSQLCSMFPNINFTMNCHSNVSFLQADTNGIRLIREQLALEAGTYNFHVSGNSKKFCRFIHDVYGFPCAYLPNLYYLDGTTNAHRPGWPQTRGILRIGAFGATRVQKNFLAAVATAMEISRELKAQTEIWINTGRNDGPETSRIFRSAQMMIDNMPNIKLVPSNWAAWPDFRKIVGNMHLLLQPSYTESFNMVSADGVAEGVPSVVSNAITWVPDSWHADADDVYEMARVGIHLINDPLAGISGLRALRRHNREGLHGWFRHLGIDQSVSGHSSGAHIEDDAGDFR